MSDVTVDASSGETAAAWYFWYLADRRCGGLGGLFLLGRLYCELVSWMLSIPSRRPGADGPSETLWRFEG